MSSFPDSPIRLHIASDPAHLPVVRAALERLCGLVGFDEAVSGDVVLAVDEALTNIIKHAYHGAPDRPIEITLRPVCGSTGEGTLREAVSPVTVCGSTGVSPVTEDPTGQTPVPLGLEIRMRDWGEQAVPERIKSRDLHDVRPGGLGVHIMRRCMDKVHYAHAADGGTVLTMVKRPLARSRP